ncbi:TonB-dependent siderophore receptor [Mucilaginibacter terrigena]|uniref:TonB-dependent siderophore receptor n=1 Tax=Mucilaginibacter terrigena TaxID=2492395 RepID=A0A4Q5LN30_9SPHI|nr:TonB-dependent siderophore receptor [Mucilaginibacter terrigena]
MKRSNPTILKLSLILTVLFAVLMPHLSFAQTRGTIQGKVVTGKNQPADNVSIGLEGTSYGSTTKSNGEFSFKAPAGSYTIIISYVGVQTVEVPVTVTANQVITVPAITVNASLSQLTEVNVIANRSNRFARKQSTDVGKIPLDNLENAQSYTTISRELLQEQQIFSVDEALRNSSGVQKLWDATTRAGDGGGYFSQRGFVTQISVRNGIAGIVSNSVDAVNVDKVEVIKGPSATLFGGAVTSFGGLINRVTKKPYDTFGAEIGQTIGSYNLNRTSLDLNTPIGSTVAFRLNTAYNYEGSFQNYGKTRTFAAAPSLSIKANDKLSFLFEAEMFFGRNSAKPFFFFYDSPKAMGVSKVSDLNIDYKQAYVNDDITMYSRNINYFAQANYKISDKFTSQTIFSSSNSFSNGHNPYFYLLTDETAVTLAESAGVTLPNPPGNNNYVFRNDQSTDHSKFGAIQIQENINGDFKIGSVRNRFVFGLDFQRQNSREIYYGNTYDFAPINDPAFNYGALNKTAADAIPPTAANSFPYIYKKNTYAAYLSDVINITDRLIASVGARVDRFENKGTYAIDGTQNSKPFTQTGFSPKLGLIYQPVKEAVSIFANYQNGFSNPDVYTDGAGNSAIPKIQNANQAEGGVKLALLNGKLNGTLSVYRIKVTNIIRSIPGSSFFGSVQDGTQTSKGFEAEFVANPVSAVNIVAGFSYNDSKFTAGDPDVLGLRPNTAGSPYLANLYISYRLPQSFVKGLGVGVGGNYASANKVINSVSQGSFELPSYTLLNASVYLDRPKYRFGLSGNNLTNKYYYTGYTTINPQRLRQFVLSASYKFK